MKYRNIKYTQDIPDYLNLLRNMEDAHKTLSSVSNSFPILDLMQLVRDYEIRVNSFQERGTKILVRDMPEYKSEWKSNRLLIISGTSSIDALNQQKDNIIVFLEGLIDKWAKLVDRILLMPKS